jgi:hypothetical protein
MRIIVAVPLAVSGFTASALAADSCQPVFDALTKLITTSSHSYMTRTAVNGGKQRTGETIMTKGKKYIRANGNWIESRVTTTEVLEQERENDKNSKLRVSWSAARRSMASQQWFIPFTVSPKPSKKKTHRFGSRSRAGCPCARSRTWTWAERSASCTTSDVLNTAMFNLRFEASPVHQEEKDLNHQNLLT